MILHKSDYNLYLVGIILTGFLIFMAITTVWVIHDVNKKAIRDVPTTIKK